MEMEMDVIRGSIRFAAMTTALAALSLSGCNCEDPAEPGWEFQEELREPDLGPDLAPDMEVDMGVDMPEIPEEPWVPEKVIEDVPFEHALNDRTSLVVDVRGTIWLGYHACNDLACSDPKLVVARKPKGGEWTYEEVDDQQGTFGIDAFGQIPYAAYLSEENDAFMVAMRDFGPEANAAGWSHEIMPVTYTGRYDGLDLTHESGRLFVSFANSVGDPIWFFTMDLQQRELSWEPLERLSVGRAQAALERGLQSDGDGGLYLVHRRGRGGAYGVARYDLDRAEWDEQVYFDERDYVVSSLVVTRENRLCMSGESPGGRLQFTCGDMESLTRENIIFDDQPVASYNSLIEGTDGSLVIAFNFGDNEQLRVGRRSPGESDFDFEVAFDGPSYGVSTALDTENKLLVSYYTCENRRCSLELLRQTYIRE
jgi:hypothetical protein